MKIDVIWLGSAESRPSWPLGQVWPTAPTPGMVHDRVRERLQTSDSPAWLFWDSTLGSPDPGRVERALAVPGDVWHAGLRLGMGGLPGLLDYALPTWPLNCDPDPDTVATSWRLSLRACLVRTAVLRHGNLHPEFRTLEGAGLELGHRYLMSGILTRHVPWIVPDGLPARPPVIPLEDELRFACARCGPFWSRWALGRAVMTRATSWGAAWKAWRVVSPSAAPLDGEPFDHQHREPAAQAGPARVTVLIPTVDRYPYLRTVLAQLAQQTIPPWEIIVIDQTSQERRDLSLPGAFPELPLTVLYQEQPGQCSSRNAGLSRATGEFVLFLDDDVEMEPTLVEAHLKSMSRFQADVSSGVADEVGAGPLPRHFTYIRASDVFPTNNTMVRSEVLGRSGLFDLAYDRGQRADGDLGMRVYLAGHLMVLDPKISVLHHHAPQGGLRTHKARVITYASSRRSLRQRHLPSVSDIYLAMRYFTPRQVREMLWIAVLGTSSIRGGTARKALKFLISLICLPDTLWRVHKNHSAAARMLGISPGFRPWTSVGAPLVGARPPWRPASFSTMVSTEPAASKPP